MFLSNQMALVVFVAMVLVLAVLIAAWAVESVWVSDYKHHSQYQLLTAIVVELEAILYWVLVVSVAQKSVVVVGRGEVWVHRIA